MSIVRDSVYLVGQDLRIQVLEKNEDTLGQRVKYTSYKNRDNYRSDMTVLQTFESEKTICVPWKKL